MPAGKTWIKYVLQFELTMRFIDWGLQNQYDEEGKEIRPRPRGDAEDEERFAAWREGRTGFP
jgi:cryptochrome